MRSPLLWFTILSLAGSATRATARAQCEARFQPGDPAGAPRGEGVAMQVFDPDGPGSAPAELVIGGALADGTAAGPLFAYDGTRWRVLGTPPAGRCSALSLFNGELVATIVTSSSPLRSDVAAWNGTTWRVLGTIFGEAGCVTVFNGRLVVGGTFASVSGVPAANVVQWNGTAWSALGGGITGTARALAAFAGVLWVGGDLTQAGGIPVGNLATWNGSAWAASASVNGTVLTMAVRVSSTATTSFLFVGGAFGSVGTLATRGVASFNQQNGWAAIGATFPFAGCVSLLVRATSSFTFELVAGPVPHLWNGSTWVELGTGRPDAFALAVFGGRYVALGSSAIVRALDAARTWVGLSGPGIDGPVTAVAATAADVVIGGSFSSISGVTMNGIARGTVGAWQPLGSGVLGGSVHAVAVLPDGDIVAGGSFTSAGGAPASRIARWNGSAWSPLGPGLGGSSAAEAVHALAVLPDGDLVAAGRFRQAGSVVVNNVARWDGAAWSAMGAGLSATAFTSRVTTLAVRPNGEVIAGGTFSESGTVPMSQAARWNGGSWSPMPGEPNAVVTALATLANGDVLVGGFFTAVGNLTSVYLARWTGSTWIAVPGLTPVALGYSLDALVPQPDGGALISGFRSQGSNPRFARYDGQAVTPLPDPAVNFANGTRASNGDVVFVGDFVRPGNVLSAYVVRYVSPCPALADRYGTGCSGSGGANNLRASRLPVLGGALGARATGMPVLGFALAVTGMAQTSIPLASLLGQGLPGCNLLATPDFIDVLPLANGSAHSNMPIPVSAPLIGLVLQHQFVAFELDGGMNIVAVTSTNGLRLTLGVF